jgi:hypothetical protein
LAAIEACAAENSKDLLWRLKIRKIAWCLPFINTFLKRTSQHYTFSMGVAQTSKSHLELSRVFSEIKQVGEGGGGVSYLPGLDFALG